LKVKITSAPLVILSFFQAKCVHSEMVDDIHGYVLSGKIV